MELRHAFVADAAQSTPDGKIWVLGGDFDTIFVPKFPVMHPAMALVLKITMQPLECDREHQLRIELVDDDGKKVHDPIQLSFHAQPDPRHPHRPVGVGMVLNFQNLRFEGPGNNSFHILVDDIELGRVPLYLVRRDVAAETDLKPGMTQDPLQ